MNTATQFSTSATACFALLYLALWARSEVLTSVIPSPNAPRARHRKHARRLAWMNALSIVAPFPAVYAGAHAIGVLIHGAR